MLINNIDIATYHGILISKNIETAEVTTYDDWLRQSLSPVYMGKKEKFKKIEVKIFIDDITENDVLTDISNLVSQLEKCLIKFDDINFYYDSLIVSKSQEKQTKGQYLLSVELKSAYAYLQDVTKLVTAGASTTFTVDGNTATPAILTLTPTMDIISLTVTGLGEDFIIKNLTTGNAVIVNGEDGTVLQGGVNKFIDFDGWEFPQLSPGSVTVTFSSTNLNAEIKYKPKYV